MELVVQLPGSILAVLYETLLRASREAVEACCDAIGIDLVDLENLVEQYSAWDYSVGEHNWDLATWFVVEVGPTLQVPPAQFEAEVSAALAERGLDFVVVFPLWVPSTPIPNPLDGRLPARPLGCSDAELALAHDGLLWQVVQREEISSLRHPELSTTGVVWRVVTIVESLMDIGDTGYYRRVEHLAARLRVSAELSPDERFLCRSMDPGVAHVRNALTHMGNDHMTFASAVETCVQDLDELWKLAGATSLAVTRHVANEFRQADPPRGQYKAAVKEMCW